MCSNPVATDNRLYIMAVNLDFMELTAGDEAVVAAAWPDPAIRNAILNASAVILPGVSSTQTLNPATRHSVAQQMQQAISGLDAGFGETLKRTLSVQSFLGQNAKQISTLTSLVIHKRDGQQGMQNMITCTRLCSVHNVAQQHLLGHTMTVDTSMGNIDQGPAASQSGNVKHPCHPQVDAQIATYFRFPNEAAPVVNGQAANLEQRKLYIVHVNALNQLLQSITLQINNLIELVLAIPENAWLLPYWEESADILASLAEIPEADKTPMVQMLTREHQGIFFYRHVLFYKITTLAVAPFGQSAITELAENKKTVMNYQICSGNETSDKSFIKLSSYIDKVELLQSKMKKANDPNPKAHTDQVFSHWYSLICRDGRDWAKYLRPIFYKSETDKTLNPNSDEIIRKMRDICAERRRTADNLFAVDNTNHVASADMERRQESRDPRNRRPPFRDAKSARPSKFSKSKSKYSSAPKSERTTCEGPCKCGDLLKCVKTPGMYHKQGRELQDKIRAYSNSSAFEKLEGEHFWLKAYARKTLQSAAHLATADDDVPMMNNSAVTATYAEQVNFAVDDHVSPSAMHQALMAHSFLKTKGGNVAFHLDMAATPTRDNARSALDDVVAGDDVDTPTPSESSDSSSDAGDLDNSGLVHGISGEEILDRLHAENDAAAPSMDVSADETGSSSGSESNDSGVPSSVHYDSEIDEFAELRANDDFIPGDRPELLELIADLKSQLANRVAYDDDIKEAYDAVAAIKGDGTLSFKNRSFIPKPTPAADGTITVLGEQFIPKPIPAADGTILYEGVTFAPPKKKSKGQHNDGTRKRS